MGYNIVPLPELIGGALVTESYAVQINADGYAPDAASAVDLTKRVLNE